MRTSLVAAINGHSYIILPGIVQSIIVNYLKPMNVLRFRNLHMKLDHIGARYFPDRPRGDAFALMGSGNGTGAISRHVETMMMLVEDFNEADESEGSTLSTFYTFWRSDACDM